MDEEFKKQAEELSNLYFTGEKTADRYGTAVFFVRREERRGAKAQNP